MSPDPGGRVLIAANRGPVSFRRDAAGKLTSRRGGGGVVSGLLSVAEHGDVLWVCAAMGDADRQAARAAPGGHLDLIPGQRPPASVVRMLDIGEAVFHPAYNGVANSVLWFIHHMLYNTPRLPAFGQEFRAEWDAFTAYNRAFADALAEGAAEAGAAGGPRPFGGARAAVQDYHLSLVPRLLAERCPGLPIAHFTHTPWAPPDYFALLPADIGEELLDGLLGADHLGFHASRWAEAFLDCCRVVLGARVSHDAGTVEHRGHLTTVGVHPLGVDAAELRARAAEADVTPHLAALRTVARGRKLLVRVDRTELSKNLLRGLAAYRELLLTHPEWRGEVTHVLFAYPSRHDLAEYRAYTDDVHRMAAAIKAEFATDDWNPLLLDVSDDYPRSLAAFRLADVLLVNPVRDGMNLVAKEGPLLSERGCALVLSREAGAATELADGALLVNPFDVTATAEALHEGLDMGSGERQRRTALIAKAAAALPPAEWFASQLSALGGR